jgi:hypothetical protein
VLPLSGNRRGETELIQCILTCRIKCRFRDVAASSYAAHCQGMMTEYELASVHFRSPGAVY